MPADSYTDVTHESYGSRLSGSLKGILFGLLIFLVAFPLLFWNEGRAIQRHKTLEEGAGTVISVSADTVDPRNQGKLIHVMGLATTKEILEDPVFGISTTGLRLSRQVSMHQWQEEKESNTKKNTGGSTTTETTYTYTKGWSESLIDSNRFKYPANHENPAHMPYRSQEFVAQGASLGDFKLLPGLVKKINNSEPLAIGKDMLPEHFTGKAELYGSVIYFGKDASSPQIGDIKVAFRRVPQTDISVVAKQVNNSFGSYTTHAGGDILLLETGLHEADEMFQNAQRANTMLTWALRFVGFLLMTVGLSAILKPLSVLADVIPAFGNLVGAATATVAAVIAAVGSLVTIAIAWIFYRPVLGLILLGVAVVCMVSLKFVPKRTVSPPLPYTTPQPPPPPQP